MRIALRVLLAGAFLACSSSAAIADDVTAVGTPIGLQITTLLADTNLQFHGRLFVKAADGTVGEYRWGGTSCGTRVLTDAQIAVLQNALDNNKMRVQLLTQDGQGISKCVVGVTVMPKSAVKLVAP
jgi:hypothetical protein